MPARKRKDPDEEQPKAAADALPNALKRPKQGFSRDTAPKADAQTEAGQEETRRELTAAQLATGRTFTYEWETFVTDLENRVQYIEVNGGGGGGGGGSARYVHTQTAASSSWAINHALSTKPGVTVVGAAGQEIFAEVHYPDDNNTVIVFGSPFAGTAYLRG